MEIREDVSLKNLTTFKIGGEAKFFVEVKSEGDVKEAYNFAAEKGLAVFILGGGSNVIISDDGFTGLVIKLNNKNLEINEQVVRVGAGLVLEDLIDKTIEHNLAGLENMTLIPGTVGGAVVQNAGSFGISMEKFVTQVKFFDIKNNEFNTFSNKECQFSYRDSIFKNKSNYLVYEVELNLLSGIKQEIQNIRQKNYDYKKASLDWSPSAGCAFKNIKYKSLDKNSLEKLNNAGVDLAKAKQFGKLSAGALIDNLGLKGFSISGAAVSTKHGNFIINKKDAKAEDIIALQSIVQQKIRNKFNIQLQLEQVLIGF